MKQKKIFVSGGTGFVGSYLLRMLIKGGAKEVYALRRAKSSFDLVASIKDQVNWLEGDILDINFLGDVLPEMDYIYHSAAMISFDPKDRKRMHEVNVEGTANMVNIALDVGVEKFLFVSSIAALGRKANRKQHTEKSEWIRSGLNSAYAISKYQAEMEVWRAIAEGLNAVIVNPSIILGSGFWDQGSSKLFQQVANGLKFHPKGTNGFVDVRDLCRIMIRLMESSIEGERFIVNAEDCSYKDLFGQIAQAMGKAAPSIAINKVIRELSWRLASVANRFSSKSSLIHKETIRASYHNFYYANEKVKTALGFNFRPLAETISATAAQYDSAKQYDCLPIL